MKRAFSSADTRKWATRYAVIIVITILGIWAVAGGNEIGERAGFMQAVLATILLWVTWSAIDRSDSQILKSQQQIDISQEMLNLESKPNLIVEYDAERYSLKLTNLGKHPILIKATKFYPLIDDESELKSKIIRPLDSMNINVPISQYYPRLVEGEFPEEYQLHVKMYYANSSEKIWRQEFTLWRESWEYGEDQITDWLMKRGHLTLEEDHLLLSFDKLGS